MVLLFDGGGRGPHTSASVRFVGSQKVTGLPKIELLFCNLWPRASCHTSIHPEFVTVWRWKLTVCMKLQCWESKYFDSTIASHAKAAGWRSKCAVRWYIH